jgi:cobalt-zinc-cadmium efflux system outer membrane protein
MKRFLFPFFLWSLLPCVWAQTPLSFDQLEPLYLEHNPFVHAKKAELRVFDGRILEAGQRPNPSLNTGLESVSNGSRETAVTVGLAQEFDVTGKRRWDMRALEHQKNAQTLQLTAEIRGALSELKKQFCRAVFLQRDLAAQNVVLQAITSFEAQNRTRLAQGDIAEVDLMRLTAEKSKVVRLIEALGHEADLEARSLAVTLGFATATVSVTPDLPPLPPALAHEALVALAREHRTDLQASREKLLGNAAALTAARRETRSPVSLEGGYKSQSGGYKGFTLGASVPLPWSNRNQGKIKEINAERDAEHLMIGALEQNLHGSLAVALEKLTFLRTRTDQLTKSLAELEEITRVARFAYEEGEGSLLEVLDSVRAHSELLLEVNRTTLDTWCVLFDLETLTGSRLTSKGASK